MTKLYKSISFFIAMIVIILSSVLMVGCGNKETNTPPGNNNNNNTEETELVCYMRWSQGDPIECVKGFNAFEFDSKKSVQTNLILHDRFESYHMGTIEMPKKDILDEYITLAEFEKLDRNYAFVTSAPEKRILKESDLSNNVYEVSQLELFKNKLYQITYHQLVGYAPQKFYVTRMYSTSNYLNCTANTDDFVTPQGYSKILELNSNQSLNYANLTQESIENYDSYDSTVLGSFFKKDYHYYIFTNVLYASYSYKIDGENKYYVFDSEGTYHEGISQEEAMQLKNNS